MRAPERSHFTHDVNNGDGSVSTSYGRVCYAHGPGSLCGGYHHTDADEDREIRDHRTSYERRFRGRFERLSGGVPAEAFYRYADADLYAACRRWRDEDFLPALEAADRAWALVAGREPGRTNVRPLPQAAWL